MQDFILCFGVQFSDEEKEKCLPTAHRMIHLANAAYENGILGLQEKVAADSDFMKMGVEVVINGMIPGLIEKVLQHAILSGGYTGADLLDKLLITEGSVLITPYFRTTSSVTYTMGAMLGEKYIPKLLEKSKTITNETIDADALIDEYVLPLSESENFEQRLLELTRIELSYLLSAVDLVALSHAFKGCNKSFIYHMRDGLSEAAFLRTCELFKELDSHDKECTLSF